ncbi:OprO/OprP family phosphate-selective porin [Singulisphaera acidiphila]|uniref:Phosphate-selective porin n=1 Tax=Singulisphaera acidiphila (strain ATCC BAA-1392 / DSM 18658 / VKM B-2454 / MOB10) TaxID=886293 RepID=L0DMX7_SINAD|nr:porin [Singulisphaera acidiphila]AGA30180.1 phosphate-selective porin [Singulisphaera acidiphila DSM 18658]
MADQRTHRHPWVYAAVLLAFGVPLAVAQEPRPPATPPPPATKLEDRLQQMEAQNLKLAEQLEKAQRRHDEQMQQVLQEMTQLRKQLGSGKATSTSSGGNSSGGGGAGTAGGASAGGGAGAARPGDGPNIGGAPDTPGGRRSPIPGYGISGATAEKKSPLKANFGPGFELMTEDKEFQLQLHQETQFDARTFIPHGDDYARSGFVFPRVRLFFNGRITQPIEYTISLNRGFSGLDLLDGFVNFRYDDRAQLKVGRFMTPFNYEQFAIQNMWLFAPERSLFTSNLGLNRQLGVQLWGNLFDNRVDYAVGAFDGPRNSYEDYNEAKDVISYLNIRPFGDQEKGSLLRDLNVGGSFSYGEQDNPVVPRAFRTASNASNASTADLFSPPFLILGDSTRERGQRTLWSAHAAYFYKQFSFFTDYNGGILRYAVNKKAAESVEVPVSGYSVAMGYFLTGESQERRTILEPKHPFSLRRDKLGPGAWELIFRYSSLEFDHSVFTGGLANPELWSQRAWTTNLGMNWYLNRYVKIYFDWQHTEFGNPVIYRQPDLKQLTNELFWIRMQLYF